MSALKKFELTPSLSILLAGVIIAAAIIFSNHVSSAAAQAAPAGAQPVAAPSHIRPPSASEHIIGSPTAPIVLIEYADFECPYCSLIYPTLKNIVSSSNGQIAWVYRDFPLTSIHPQANPAANAAECITEQLGNTGFWKFADTIFANQSAMSPQYYAQLAQEFGANPAEFASCVATSKYQSKIDADTAEAESNGGNGTPFTIVLNTKTNKAVPISGALPEAEIMSVINSVK